MRIRRRTRIGIGIVACGDIDGAIAPVCERAVDIDPVGDRADIGLRCGEADEL